MRLKSYFVQSVEEAVDQARTELGEEAMLISSRPTEQDLSQLGRYEVVFGLAPSGNTSPAPPNSSAESISSAPADVVLRELAELRKQMDDLRGSMTRSTVTRATEQLSPEMARIFNRLTGAGFSAELSQELTEAVAQRVRPHTERSHRMILDQRDLFARDLMNAVVEEEVASRFEVAPTLGEESETSTTVLLVGPPGAGKTTSLVKLALRFGLKAKRSLHLLSLDTLRIGGWEQLSRYARISSVDFKPVHDWTALQAILDRPSKGLTLIDTPGFSKADGSELAELAQLVRKLSLEVHLVLPAYLSLDVAQRMWKQFAVFEPAKMILTHMDAVDSNATAIEFAIRSGLPLSYLSAGQRIPEDMRKAAKQELSANLLPQERTVSVAA